MGEVESDGQLLPSEVSEAWLMGGLKPTAASTREKCNLAAAPPLRLLVARPNQMLVGAVAPSSAARQGLLAEYVVATDEDRTNGLKMPTVAMWSLLSGLNC